MTSVTVPERWPGFPRRAPVELRDAYVQFGRSFPEEKTRQSLRTTVQRVLERERPGRCSAS
ncbi:hypothetical protein [Streptomyces sp. NPDC020747]|uniref:hypothetical protein n=1 Tax=Streptomyces sp. NPDC020747 TaxID=3365086 RepID=UPI0037A78240